MSDDTKSGNGKELERGEVRAKLDRAIDDIQTMTDKGEERDSTIFKMINNLRIEIAVLKTKMAMIGFSTGLGGVGIVELIKRLAS